MELVAKEICQAKIEGRDKHYIQKLQQRWDDMNSKRKGNTYEHELVKMLNKAGFTNVVRAWGSDVRSIGQRADVDLVADGIKIQAKRRKVIPKWLSLGSCDVLMFRGDREFTRVSMRFEDWVKMVTTIKSLV